MSQEIKLDSIGIITVLTFTSRRELDVIAPTRMASSGTSPHSESFSRSQNTKEPKSMKRAIDRSFVVLCSTVLIICLVATASAQTNLAPSGTGYTWHNMTSATATTGKTAAAGINNRNLTTGVYCNPNNVTPNEWEGAGVIFSAPQTISKVVLYNEIGR